MSWPCVAVLVLLTMCGRSECKTSFVKDLRTDLEFPPRDTQNVPGLPDGHLRPLGWQKKPDGKVREEKEAIQPQTFYTRYIKTARPAVFRNIIKRTDVLENWENDDYLMTNFGKINVTITVKRETTNSRTKRRMLFRKFLLDYMYENWYLASTIHKDLLKELSLPSILTCGTYKNRLTETELWMSSGGTSSLLHSHSDHNLHCVVDGRKDFIVIDPKHKSVFKFEEHFPHSGSGFSPINMDMINMFKYAKIAQTPWVWTTLWQGDCLYVPAGHLHQVRSYGRGISYSVQFAPSTKFNASDCSSEADDTKGKKKKKDKKTQKEEGEDEKKLTLADVTFVWTFKDGERRLTNENLDPESMREVLLIVLGDKDTLYRESFEHFYKEALQLDPEKPPAEEAFHILTPNDTDHELTRADIQLIKPSRLQLLCDIFNRMNIRVKDEL